MNKFIAWIKANPWKAAVIVLAIGAIALASVTYGCGYVKGCNKAKEAVEEQK